MRSAASPTGCTGRSAASHPDAPGYKRLRFAPVPGRGVVRGSSTLRTPYGRASCAWSVDGTDVTLEVEVPPNTSATVVRPGQDEEPLTVLAGKHRWTYAVADAIAADWADPPDG